MKVCVQIQIIYPKVQVYIENKYSIKIMKSQTKSIEQIFTEFKEKNTIGKQALVLCQRNIHQIFKRFQSCRMRCQDIQAWVSSNKQRLQAMKDYSENQSDEFLIELFVIMMKGAEFAFDGKIPRYHQIICLWLNVHSKKTILEVKTGEGKTMIVALTALFFALRGKKVDVFTSNAALAMTETQKDSCVRKLFTIFKISLGDICSERTLKPQDAYENQVLYGTTFEFQADFLRRMFSGRLKYFKDRQFDHNHVAILDEVDALLIDRMRDSTRLSSQKPLFECIRAILILIHQIKKELTKAKSQYCGPLQVKILGEVIKFNKHVNEELDFQDEDVEQYIKEEKAEIFKIVKEALNTKIRFLIPNYLIQGEQSYINIMIPLWINSSYQVRKYKEDVHFTICKTTNQIIPIEISTGTYQKRTKWSNGVHQFLELKYEIEPSVDTIVTNYESNLIFFRRYEHHLYGMTGTISQSIGVTKHSQSIFQEFLRLTYQVNIYKIPTAKKRLLNIQKPKLFADEQEWMQAIQRDAKKIASKRMVLIIFNTIKEAKSFIQEFSSKNQYNIVQLYDHDEYFNSLNQNFNQRNTIIVSTNLGGRGTDIQITDENILKNGGLYVMMTYFAPNWRIEEQAFGRAGRNGQPGSGCFYLNISQANLKGKKIEQDEQLCQNGFDSMVAQRKKYQLSNFEESKLAIKNQMLKRQLLDKFYNKYLKKSHKRIEELTAIIDRQDRYIDQCKNQLIQYYFQMMEADLVEEQWGIFLKRKIPDRQLGKQVKIQVDFNQFVMQYHNNRKNNDVNPGFFARCGSSLFNVSPELSQQLFNQALSKNSKSWVNKYYKIYFDLKKYEDKQLPPYVILPLIDSLKQVCQIIIVQFSLEMAIAAASRLTQAKKEQFNNLKMVYIDLMAYLQSIGQSLQKYVVKEKKRMTLKVDMKNNDKNTPSLAIKGLNHIICDFQMMQIQSTQKKKGGFLAAVLSGIKSVVMTAVSIVSTVVAVVATPIIVVCGGNKDQLWQGIGKLWKKTGQCWKDTFDRLPQIAVIGLSLLSIFMSNGAAIPAVIELISWMYLRPGQTITSAVPVPLCRNGNSSQIVKLVEITGTYRLNKQTQIKIQRIQAKLNQQITDINKNYEEIYMNIQNLKKKGVKNKAIVSAIEDFVFSQDKGSSFKEKVQNQKSKSPNKQQKQKKQKKPEKTEQIKKQDKKIDKKQQNKQENRKRIATKIINQKEIIEKANSQIQKNNEAQKSIFNQIQEISSNSTQNIYQSFKKNVQAKKDDLTKKIDSRTAKQEDIDLFNKNIQQDNQSIKKFNENYNDYVNNNIKLEKMSLFIPAKTLTATVKLNNIDSKLIETQISKIQKPIRNYISKKEQTKQIIEIFSSKDIQNDPLNINPQEIKNKQTRNILEGLQESYLQRLKSNAEEKENKQIREKEELISQQLQQVTLEHLNKIEDFAENIKKTPIQNPKQINNPYFYEELINFKCRAESIQYCNVQSRQQLVKILQERQRGYSVIIYNKTVIFKSQQASFVKCYEQQSQENQQDHKIIKSNLKNASILFADFEGCKFCGNAMVSDLNKFIFNSEICKNSTLLIPYEVKRQYIRALIIQYVIREMQSTEVKALKNRRDNDSEVPLFFLPFELGLNSQEFKKFGYRINDTICRDKGLIDSNQKSSIKELIQSVYNQLANEQEKDIQNMYPELIYLIKKTKKKPNRR